jgi:hypothetical protein
MTSFATLQEFSQASQDLIGEAFYSDTWRSTSFLIQLLVKQESYYESLNEQHPDDDFYGCLVAVQSALELINMSYTVPVTDERFEKVEEMYEAVVNTFIAKMSDDAIADLAFLGGISNFVTNMRVAAINQWIEETGPSETKFEALKLAKRDAQAVTLATKHCASVLFGDDN